MWPRSPLTRFTKNSTGTSCTIWIGPREGRYEGMPEQRSYIVVMGGVGRMPSSVKTDLGEHLECAYDSTRKEVSFVLPPMKSEDNCVVTVKY